MHWVSCWPFLCISLPELGRESASNRCSGRTRSVFQTRAFDPSAAHVGLTYPRYLFVLKWIATCGLKKLKLKLSKCLGPSCRRQKLAHRAVSAKHCSVIPSIEINVSHMWCSSPPSPVPYLLSVASGSEKVRGTDIYPCLYSLTP